MCVCCFINTGVHALSNIIHLVFYPWFSHAHVVDVHAPQGTIEHFVQLLALPGP